MSDTRPLAINRDRADLLRAIDNGLVVLRRTDRPGRGTEVVRRNRQHTEHLPVGEASWPFRRCGPAVQKLVDAELVVDVQDVDGEDGPWPFALTGEGKQALVEHERGRQ